MLTLDMTTLDTEEEREDTLGEIPELPAELPAHLRPAPGPQLQLVAVQDTEPPRARRILAVGARWRGLAPVILALASGCGQEANAGVWLVSAILGTLIFKAVAA